MGNATRHAATTKFLSELRIVFVPPKRALTRARLRRPKREEMTASQSAKTPTSVPAERQRRVFDRAAPTLTPAPSPKGLGEGGRGIVRHGVTRRLVPREAAWCGGRSAAGRRWEPRPVLIPQRGCFCVHPGVPTVRRAVVGGLLPASGGPPPALQKARLRADQSAGRCHLPQRRQVGRSALG